MKTPRLSVIVPVRNRPRLLRLAVESLLAEKICDLEVIICDDGSDDDTLRAISDLPVVQIRSEISQGAAAARNRGVAASRGEYLAFLDSDDLLVRRGLRWRLEWMEHHLEPAILGDVGGVINSEGKYLGSAREILWPNYRRPPAVITHRYLVQTGIFPCQLGLVMLTRRHWDRVGALDEKLMSSEDLDFFFRLSALSPIPYLARSAIFMRVHDNHLSGTLEGGKFRQSPRTRATGALVRWAHGAPKL